MATQRILALAALALLVAACDKDKDVAPPAELVDFNPVVRIDKVWSVGTKDGDDVLRLGLRPAVLGDRVFAAGHGGDVRALDLATGREAWRADTDVELAGGPAVGDGIVVVGGSGGELVALDATSGAKRWQVAIGGEVLTAPTISNGIVVTRTVDGRLRGIRVSDGGTAWSYEQPVPRLTLRGNGAPVVDGDMVFAGLDNGKVVALSLATGDLLWSTTVAPSHGRTEIERLVDIDSPVRILGEDVFVVGYQGRVAMLARDTGQLWWGRDMSSNRGLVADGDTLYVTTADSNVVALRRRDGTPVWTQDAMLRRGLTAPALSGDTLVVGDFEGYLHWLDAATGQLLARGKTGGGRMTNAPMAVGDLLLLETDSGEVQAWRAKPRAAG
ncbi:MAG TPA: outer membrane protein assembly factor BamB [Candidatus Binatia bacterium]|nr:outer membrane protein assembly factor BamB [Candidatus Binatia bacterium]